MSIDVEGFEWDEHNVTHLQHAHPDVSLDLLEDIVTRAKSYRVFGLDQYGKRSTPYSAARLRVLFNLKPGRMARIFSVHEVK